MPKPFALFGIVMGIISFFAVAHAEEWTLPTIDVMGFLTIGLIMFGFHLILSALNLMIKNQHKIMQQLRNMDDK